MGCCNPNYRETVNEEEKRVNAKGTDSLSLPAKLILAAVMLSGIGFFFYLT
ncbi:hypothetical protein [Sporosarcina globispora]|uniref:hypothetical protein n=1 Tax=Sporosarcina globispora TaxID=1459 RepID=UPI000A945F35|nr:hypothetical protein [Sporosarcina globispora]